MANIHLILQGKGGVGKSYVSALTSQILKASSASIQCFDTDPVNRTFQGYEGLGVEGIDIIDGDEINPRHFDGLIESLATTKATDIIIDNGASTFIPLTSYMVSNGIVDLLNTMGHSVFIHTVITGGQAQYDTLHGLNKLVDSFKDTDAKLIVWVNEFWGEIIQEGKTFEEMKAYKSKKSEDYLPKSLFINDSEIIEKIKNKNAIIFEPSIHINKIKKIQINQNPQPSFNKKFNIIDS